MKMEQRPVRAILFLILTLYTPHIDTTLSTIQPNKLVSYSIPEKRLLKKALGYHEDTYLNFTELATKYKYNSEVHTVITDDGYVLGLFRILPKCRKDVQPFPVLLVHGIFDTADLWIVSGKTTGLGYILADNCYDVWTSNSRGNHYSRRHLTLDPNKDPEYWNYSFDEIGNFDIPANIDYVLKTTGYSKLFFIGHSQGTTQYFTMGSLRPNYSDKIVLAIQLAPVAWMKHFMNPIAVVIARNYELVKTFLESTGFREVFARDRIVHFLAEFLCEMSPQLCELGFTLSTGYKEGTISLTTLSVSVGHLFSGSSVKNLSHFAQLVLSGKFQRYDEGVQGNLQRYSSPRPPKYNVSLISTPTVLVAGRHDTLASIKDVDILSSKLTNLIEYYIVPRSYWSHHNSVWGINAPELVFPKILDYFNKYV